MSANIQLKDCLKHYTFDQDKTSSPEQTVAHVKERLARAGLDVLQYTERIDNGRLDIPVFVSACGKDARQVMPTRKQMGKGATPAQAEASAVMEMVERFSFFHFLKNEPMMRATYDDVRDRALPFEHIAAAVHHDPDDLARAMEALKGLELSWTPAFNLTRGREFLVPFDWFYEINEFNGPAAGNAIEEAVMQSLAELVERHVCALISRGRIPTPTIDPDSLATQAARDLTAKFERAGIRLFAKDFTQGMGVPTVGALAYDPASFPDQSEIVFTAGTASDPEKAYIRALTEVAQLAGDFNTKANFVASGLPKYTDLAQAEYVMSSRSTVPISFLPNIGAPNMKHEVEAAVEALALRGFEVYVVNTTHPSLDIPAVYSIVPGAHFRERAVASSVPFFAAKLLSRCEDPAEIMAGLERIGRLYPDAHYLKFFQGELLVNQGRPDEAEPVLRAGLNLNPPPEDEAGLLTYLGLALKDMERYEEALDVLSRSADIDSERSDTFNLTGFCYFKTRQYEKAIEAFRQVLRIDPGSAMDYANIGRNFQELGQIDEAVRHYKIALDLDPALEWVWNYLVQLKPE